MPSNKSAFGQIEFFYYCTLLPHRALRPKLPNLGKRNIFHERYVASGGVISPRGQKCHSRNMPLAEHFLAF